MVTFTYSLFLRQASPPASIQLVDFRADLYVQEEKNPAQLGSEHHSYIPRLITA